MLERSQRLTAGQDFSAAVRRGRRAGSRTVVVHLVSSGATTGAAAPRAGFVVSRAVGNAVVRNRVRRRLRHLVRERLRDLPPGATLVVRALVPAAQASSAVLAADLDAALGKLARRRSRGAGDIMESVTS